METRCSTIAALVLLCFLVSSNSFQPKPGNCPRQYNTLWPQPLPTCYSDMDCPGDNKCCFYYYKSICVPPVPTLPMCPIIPGAMPICLHSCSSDSDCPVGEKCCYNVCGRLCLPQEDIKPGKCPELLPYTPTCLQRCRLDSSCRNELKCCPTKCGFTCVEPIF